jgi:hypothetical protein
VKLIPGKKGKGGGWINEGACSRHEEETRRTNFVPLGVSENANYDTKGEQSGGRADKSDKSESSTHEDNGE